MKLESIKLRNFLSWKDVEVFPEESLFVYGENGSGKTSLFIDSILFALYGETRCLIDSVIMEGEESCNVTIKFIESDGTKWEVERGRDRGKKTTLHLWRKQPDCEDEILTGISVGDTEKKIIEMFGSKGLFLNSVIFCQQDLSRFCYGTDKERMDFLTNVLGLGYFEKALNFVREDKRVIEKDIISLKAKLEEVLSRDIDLGQEIADLEKHIECSELEARNLLKDSCELESKISIINDKIREEEKQKSIYDQRYGQYCSAVARLEELRILILDKEKDLEKFRGRDFDDEESKVNLVITSEEEQVKEHRDLHSANKVILRDFEEKISLLDKKGNECFICGSLLNAEKKEELLCSYKGKIKEVSAYLLTLSAIIEKKNSLIFEKKKELKIILEQKKAKESIEFLLMSFKTEMHTVEQKTKEGSNYERLLDETKERIIVLVEDRQSLNTTLSNISAQLSSLRVQQGKWGTSLSACKELLDKKERYSSQLQEKEKALEVLLILEKAFSPQGIRSFVFENSLQFLEEKLNFYLATFGSEVKVNFVFQVLKVSGEVKEKFELLFYDGQSDRVFNTFSGGEKKRIELASFFAIRDLLNTRGGQNFNFMILDEVFDALDVKGIECICRFLVLVVEQYIIISHSSEVKDQFDSSVCIKKIEGKSVIG